MRELSLAVLLMGIAAAASAANEGSSLGQLRAAAEQNGAGQWSDNSRLAPAAAPSRPAVSAQSISAPAPSKGGTPSRPLKRNEEQFVRGSSGLGTIAGGVVGGVAVAAAVGGFWATLGGILVGAFAGGLVGAAVAAALILIFR